MFDPGRGRPRRRAGAGIAQAIRSRCSSTILWRLAAAALAALAAGCSDDGGAERAVRTVTVSIQAEDARTTPTTTGLTPSEVELAGEACENAGLVPEEGNLAAVRQATLCLVNAERTSRGLEPLQDNAALSEAARAKAQHMVEQEYFAHVGPEGRNVRDWVRGTGYLEEANGYLLGENLGWASEGTATPRRLVASWMASPSHRENILREGYRHSGIGIALGAPQEQGGGATYVQIFGRR